MTNTPDSIEPEFADINKYFLVLFKFKVTSFCLIQFTTTIINNQANTSSVTDLILNYFVD